MDPALWALLITSAVLVVLWYRSRPQPGPEASVPPPPAVPAAPWWDEWSLTSAETVIRTRRED